MERQSLIPVLFLTLLISLSAQYDPHFEWKVIKTEHHRIIFPALWEEEGLKVAFLAEKYHPLLREDLSIGNEYIYPIILTMDDRITNGFVSTFPRRSVWYSFPSGSGMGTTGWYETLAIHEGRHMAQFERLDSRTAHLMFYLGGEAWSSLSVAVTPSWLMEGDAVIIETELSRSGRGRLGSFMEGMKSVTGEEDYSYYKMLHGSYGDFIPNAYSFGYAMTGFLKENYSTEYMNNILSETALVPLPLVGYSRAIKEITGLAPRLVYKEMREELRRETERQIREKGELIQGELFSPPARIYTEYSHLNPGREGSLYVLKSDLNRPSRVYRITEEKEEALFALTPHSSYSAAEGIHIWDEYRVNMRYPTRGEAEIYLKKENDNPRKKTLPELYSPSLSPRGDRFAALGYSSMGGFYLQIQDMGGENLKTYDFPKDITMASQLSWASEDSLLMTVSKDRGESIWSFQEKQGFHELIPFTTDDLGRPVSGMGGVFFTLDRETGREICFLKEGALKQITNTPYGTDYPAVVKNRLYFVNLKGSEGYEIRFMDLMDSPGFKEITLAPPLQNVKETIPINYEVEDYHAHSFFHPVGWGFTTLFMPDPSDIEIPFTLISYNEMKTILWEGGLYYNLNENTLNYKIYGQFSPFFPIITTQLEIDERLRNQISIHDFLGAAGLYLPFGFSRSRDQTALNLQGKIIYQYSWTEQNSADNISLLGSLETYHSRAGGYRSLQPQWEEYVSLTYRHSLEAFPYTYLNSQLHLFTPGLLPSHGMGFYAYYENNIPLLSSAVPQVRGYAYDPIKEQLLLKGEYVLPLFYPDFALGGLLYIPEISAELYYDHQFDLSNSKQVLSSTGVELILESHLLSLPIKLEGGLRFSWLIEEREPVLTLMIKGLSL